MKKHMQKFGIGEKVGVITNHGTTRIPQIYGDGTVTSAMKLMDNGSYKWITVDVVEHNVWAESGVTLSTRQFELNERTGCYRSMPIGERDIIITSPENSAFADGWAAAQKAFDATRAHDEAQREYGRKVTAERIALCEAMQTPRWREYEIVLETTKMTFNAELALHDDNVMHEDAEGVNRVYTEPRNELVLHVEGRNLNLTLSPDGARMLAFKLIEEAEKIEALAAQHNVPINVGMTPPSYL